MDTRNSIQGESNFLSTYLNIYLNEYVKQEPIDYYDPEDLLNKEKIDDFKCAICLCILNEPLNCSEKINSHSFCKTCINNYLKYLKNLNGKNTCPTCNLNFEFKISIEKYNDLKNLSFKCLFNNEGCNDILPYSDYLSHVNNCEYNNIKYECHIMKYNYNKKNLKNVDF